eukprot:CAMPEP_0181486468 /NCGR_PEP_ID=MMETSP1110-20121109/47186_1 /TAXON_ID=174948 /ORGANISM="Symbiodinium sp., Strain CCMP421" /LENGTH=131 /DNA_ID=CAMNT_0023612679 /DNA_START=86 /DNA_END=479 /DNA_ORIENTATION=-
MIAAFPMKGNFRWPRRWTFVRLPAVAQKCRRAELPRMKFPALPGRKLAFGGMTMKRNLKENLFEKRVLGAFATIRQASGAPERGARKACFWVRNFQARLLNISSFLNGPFLAVDKGRTETTACKLWDQHSA